jgi:phosphohistidine phosphatase
MEKNGTASPDLSAKSRAPLTEYQLYIMRHGVAVGREAGGYPDDSKRPLTPQGRTKVKRIGKGLKRVGMSLDWIVSSPLVRASETAKIVADSLGSDVPVQFSDTLSPGGAAEALLSFLARYPSRRRTLVVGHEPDLGTLAARLLGCGRQANLAFKKGGCCLIAFAEFPPKSAGELVWWLPPGVLRRIA